MKTETFILPVYWASYLINGDCSGLEDSEIKAVDHWLKMNGFPHICDVSEDTWFAHSNDWSNQGSEVAGYTAIIRE